jgi:hypothetical protein
MQRQLRGLLAEFFLALGGGGFYTLYNSRILHHNDPLQHC